MVDVSKNTYSLRAGNGADKRVDMQHVASATPDITINTADINDMRANEAQYKRLFLRALSSMLKEAGYDVNAEEMFRANRELFFASQPIVYTREFPAQRESKRVGQYGFRNESTTRYLFDFNFQEREIEGVDVRIPIYGVDNAAIEVLRTHGVSAEAITEWTRHFVRMVDLADHDYIHQIVIPNAQHGEHIYCEKDVTRIIRAMAVRGPIEQPGQVGYTIENHALALHAQIMARLFKDSPARKLGVLRWAVEAYSHLYAMQEQALSHCRTNEERTQVNEAITYLAEIHTHRFFRLFSPDDPALRQPMDVVVQGREVQTSVAEAMEKLTLVTPERFNPAPESGLEKLYRHCSDWLGDTYKAIHHLDRFALAHLNEPIADRYARLGRTHITRGGNIRPGDVPTVSNADITYHTAVDVVGTVCKAEQERLRRSNPNGGVGSPG